MLTPETARGNRVARSRQDSFDIRFPQRKLETPDWNHMPIWGEVQAGEV